MISISYLFEYDPENMDRFAKGAYVVAKTIGGGAAGYVSSTIGDAVYRKFIKNKKGKYSKDELAQLRNRQVVGTTIGAAFGASRALRD